VVLAPERVHPVAVDEGKALSLYRTRGAAPRMPGLSAPVPPPPRGLFARLAALFRPAERRKRRAAAAFNATAQGSLGRGEEIGSRPEQAAKGIVTTMATLGIPTTLAVQLALTGARTVNSWRLLRDETQARPAQAWLFATEDRRLLEVDAGPQGISIRDLATGKAVVYPPNRRAALH
jgi:hypothetical protein